MSSLESTTEAGQPIDLLAFGSSISKLTLDQRLEGPTPVPTTDSGSGISLEFANDNKRDNAFPVSIKQVSGRGRGFFASRDIPKGEVVFKAVPLTWAFSEDWVGNTCGWCFAFNDRKRHSTKAATEALEHTRPNTQTAAANHTTKTRHNRNTVHYKGAFCSEQCMNNSISSHGGKALWLKYMHVLNCIELDIQHRKAAKPRVPKRTKKDSARDLCQVSLGGSSKAKDLHLEEDALITDPLISTFPITTSIATASRYPRSGAVFNPDDVSDGQLEEWIGSVWDTIVAHCLFTDGVPDCDQRELVRLIVNGLFMQERTSRSKPDCDSKSILINQASWSTDILSRDLLRDPVAPPMTLMYMQSNEVVRFRAGLHDLHSETPNDTVSTPATVVPVQLPYNPTVEQITTSSWGSLFKKAAQAYSLLQNSWNAAKETIHLSDLTNSRFRDFYYREMSNSFGIWDPPGCTSLVLDSDDHVCPESAYEQEFLGFAIYPTAVFFNHSCGPNITKYRVGREMCFVSRTEVKRGEELFISYGSVIDPVEERRKRLEENYHFRCACDRCVAEDSNTHESTIMKA